MSLMKGKSSKKEDIAKREAELKKRKQKMKNIKVVEEENTDTNQNSIEVAAPFSDGIVSAKFQAFPTTSRSADAEVELLKSFLSYFSVTTPFIGTIDSKISFMKKKGGRLL